MKLELKNIAKIGEASIEINGITVIAGENNTGKSTVGRTLFAVFNSFFNIHKQLEMIRVRRLEGLFDRFFMSEADVIDVFPDSEDIAKTIVSDIDYYKDLEFQGLKEELIDLMIQDGDDWTISLEDKNYLDEVVLAVTNILNIKNDRLISLLLEKNLSTEFNEQITNIFSDEGGEIKLTIKNTEIALSINSEGRVDIANSNNISLRTEAVYIDDPFVLDEINSSFSQYYENRIMFFGHRDHLRLKLSNKNSEANIIDEILAKEKLGNIYGKLSAVCDGEIIGHKRNRFGEQLTGYKTKRSDRVLNVRNLSTGLKTFVILKTLLTMGVIENNGTIILDEPEIHLHPEWQLVFAELIVLIQKEFGVHVLLNTHSPYFLNAIEVYAAKYGINKKCRYYLASNNDDVSIIEDVTKDIEQIYFKLARPLQSLENQGSLL